MKKRLMICLMLTCLLLTACAQTSDIDRLAQPLVKTFEDAGYACSWGDAPSADTPVGIYLPSAWRELRVGEETVLVYFDESNRADYLAEGVDQAQYGLTRAFGLRFVVAYRGADEGVRAVVEAMAP